MPRKTSAKNAMDRKGRPVVPELPAPPEGNGIPPVASDPVAGRRWGWYLLSILVPLGGLFVGLFFYDSPDPAVRRVGRNCLLTGFVLWILLPLLLAAAVLLLFLFTLMSWVAQMAPAY